MFLRKGALCFVLILLHLLIFIVFAQASDADYLWQTYNAANGALENDNLLAVYVEGPNIYAATEGGLTISKDGGKTWQTYNTANSSIGSEYIRGIYVNGSNIYAATGAGLSISRDGGNTWENKTVTDGLGSNDVRGVYAVSQNIYVATYEGGLSISTNDGATWTTKKQIDGLASDYVFSVYAVSQNIYVATNYGLSISNNDGATWTTIRQINGLGSNIVNNVYVVNGKIYAATNGGLSISADGGNTWENKTATSGLGSNIVYDVHVLGANIYAATNLGLSISTDEGASFLNKTTADGLANNMVLGVYSVEQTVYAATYGGGLSAATLKSSEEPAPLVNIFNYFFVRNSAEDISYRSQCNGIDVAKIQLSETILEITTELTTADFTDVTLETREGGKPYINVPENNPVAQAVNNDTTGTKFVTAYFYGLPTNKFPAIVMDGQQITDLNGNVFPQYNSYIKNINWDNNTGTLTFEITHFSEYGIPALSGKSFSGTGAATTINVAGSNLAVSAQHTLGSFSASGTAALDKLHSVQKISGLAYETVLTDVTQNADYLYQALVPGQTYGISFEYIQRGNNSDTIELSATLERQNTGNFNIVNGTNTLNYTVSKIIEPWQVASFNILINADNAYSLDTATLNVSVLVNGTAPVSYSAFANAYAATFDSDRAYGGENFSYIINLIAEGYDLEILERIVSVNAPAGYTGEVISSEKIVPGTKLDHYIVIKNNSFSDAVSINIKDVIPANCHLYYIENVMPTVNGALVWEWKGATANVAPKDNAIWYEITIPGQSVVTASYSVTLD